MNSVLVRALAAACVALALLAGWQWIRASRALNALAEERAAIAQQILQATITARAEEQRRTLKIQEVADAAELARQSAEADARGAAGAADRLRQRAAQLAASCSARDSAAPVGSPAASTPADLLAHMLGGAAAAAGELGSYADRSRIAGQQCEASYDALRVK